MRKKMIEYLAFLEAFSCKFISKLIKPKIFLIYLNFSNLLKRKTNKINLLLKEVNISNNNEYP